MDVETRRIVLQRIGKLFRMAREIIREEPALAQRYIQIARKVAMVTRVHLPEEFRRQVCRNCNSLILPGVNCRVRIRQRREPHLVITCLSCGDQIRRPLTKRKACTETSSPLVLP